MGVGCDSVRVADRGGENSLGPRLFPNARLLASLLDSVRPKRVLPSSRAEFSRAKEFTNARLRSQLADPYLRRDPLSKGLSEIP